MAIFFLVLLLALSSSVQSQCSFPTDDEVVDLLQFTILLLEIQDGEPGGTVSDVFPQHFVCLATRGLDMYESVSIVVNYTFTPNSGLPAEMRTDQFELACSLPTETWNPTSNKLEEDLPPMPFDIELKDQCVSCTQTHHPTLLYYDNITNCFGCHPTCTSQGGGYCTSSGTSNCCPFFNGDTGECVSDCTSIHPNFGPNEQFICVCDLSCDAGFVANASCSGCESVCDLLQPCGEFGSCNVNSSEPDGYVCVCSAGYAGPNCTACNLACGVGFVVDAVCDTCEHVCISNNPCGENGSCDMSSSSPAGYTCTCTGGYTGQNCTTPPLPCPTNCNTCDNIGCCVNCSTGFDVVNCSCELSPPTVSCPAECNGCDAGGCCTACSPGYQTDTCTCATMMSTMLPSPSPSCEVIEGCITCTLDVSGMTCCSQCSVENGFTLDGCECSAVMSTMLPSPSLSCEAIEGCITCTLDVSGMTCCSQCSVENGFTLDGCVCSVANNAATGGLSTTTVAGVAVGIILFFIIVVIAVVVIFLVILYRAKQPSKPYPRKADIASHNELATIDRLSMQEEEGGYETVPYVLSATNKIPTVHETPTKNDLHNEGDDEYLSMSDPPALPDRTYTFKSTESDNIYDNDDDLELLKSKADTGDEIQSEKKRYVTLRSNQVIVKRMLSDNSGNNDNDDSGYMAMNPMVDESEIECDQSNPQQDTTQ